MWQRPLVLEHLISHEAPRNIILSGVVGTDVPSLHAFLEDLSVNRPEYDSNDIDYDAPRAHVLPHRQRQSC